ncbi:MAG: zinc ribbon domain-containing protein [Thermoplasmata archaeon]
MPKKKQQEPVPQKKPEVADEEEVACPICGKPVGLEVASCPYCGAEFEEEAVVEEAPEKAKAAPPVADEEEMAECPVCGKMVSIKVSTCPYCGAEFEEETVTEERAPEPVKATPAAASEVVAEEEEKAECPVCGKMVGLTVPTCPYCGAEFEEEEVEEIIEVEEVVPKATPAKTSEPAVAEETVEAAEEEPVPQDLTSILDFRVIGASLIVLGILGSQIAFMIDWYWSWVPPIEDHLAMFVAIPAVIIVLGLLVFLLIKRFASEGKKVPRPVPWASLSMFLFGILALVVMMLWDPINSALQSSNMAVGVAFVVVLLVGAGLMFLGSRSSSRAAAA